MAHDIQIDLLGQIEAHCMEYGISQTAFGREAVNDACFVKDLKDGRDPRWSTIQRVLGYMAAQDAPQHGASA